MNRKGRRGREKEKTAGQFRIHHNNPADLDKLSFRSGANLQREMSNRDRRKMQRDERRTQSRSATRWTSSTDPMDTDEADRITRNVLLRTQQRRASSDGEDTLVGSDLERTMVEKKAQQQEPKKETKRRVDNTKGIRNPEPMEISLNRPAINASGIFKEGTPRVEPPIRLTFGVSPSLETKTEPGILGAIGGMSISENRSAKESQSPEYVDNDFYLPLPGCPLLSSLDPERTNKLTLRGNRAKMIWIGLWASIYATSRFLIDDRTGEIYKVCVDDLALIREFGVLNEEEARKQFLKSSPSSIRKSEEDKQDLVGPNTGAIPKTTHTSEGPEEQLKPQIEDTENPLRRYEKEQEEQRAALKDYQDCRTVRRNKELELIGRGAAAGKDQVPTKAEMDQVRMEIEREYQSCLRKESDASKKYYDKCPSELESDEDDVSSQVSMKSYQAEDSWTE